MDRNNGFAELREPELVIRPARADEWALWRDLRVAALADSPQAFTARLSEWSTTGLTRWRERFDSTTAHNFVAEKANHAIGLVSGIVVSADECQLRSLWVSAHERGTGVADRLVEAVTTWAEQRNAAVVTLRVVATNEPAIKFYRRHGFVEADEVEDRRADGSTDERAMVKVVAVSQNPAVR